MNIQAEIDKLNKFIADSNYVVWFQNSRTPIGSIIRENPHYQKPNWGIWGNLYYPDTIDAALDTVIVQPLGEQVNWRD
jgi:hypothetical protein